MKNPSLSMWWRSRTVSEPGRTADPLWIRCQKRRAVRAWGQGDCVDSRSLRIALLSYRSLPTSGGQGVYIRHLSRELLGLGHSVHVFSGPPYPELVDGVELTQLPSLELWREPDPFRIPRPSELSSVIDVVE